MLRCEENSPLILKSGYTGYREARPYLRQIRTLVATGAKKWLQEWLHRYERGLVSTRIYFISEAQIQVATIQLATSATKWLQAKAYLFLRLVASVATFSYKARFYFFAVMRWAGWIR